MVADVFDRKYAIGPLPLDTPKQRLKPLLRFLPDELTSDYDNSELTTHKPNRVAKTKNERPIETLIEERLAKLEQMETVALRQQQDKVLSNNLTINQLISNDDDDTDVAGINPDFDFDEQYLDEDTDYADTFFDNGEGNDEEDEEEGATY